MAADLDIATTLATNIAALTIGANCFAGPVRGYSEQIPHKAVFVTLQGGGTSRAILAESPTRAGRNKEERSVLVQIRVRSDPDGVTGSFQDAQQLAQDVYDLVAYNPLSGYREFNPLAAGPLYIGKDDNGHDEWSMNFEAIYYL